jgi:negative regulator of replication initiation
MHRTQISLEKWQYQYVVERARQTQTSISDVIRRLVTQAAQAQSSALRESDPVYSIIGIGAGDGAPVSRDHDKYLYGKE